MSLLHFPTELLLFSATFLGGENDINALSQASSRLYTTLNPYLYRHNSRNSGSSALLWAARHGNLATARKSIQEGAKLGLTDSRGMTPLCRAALSRYDELVKLLLDTGQANINAKDNSGRTPFSYAANYGHEAVVKLLLKTGQVHIDAKDDWGRTPFSHAAQSGREAIVKLLLESRQVDVDAKDNRGQTPLSYAAQSGHEVVEKLLRGTKLCRA